jgi:3-(3-hydroxy-phenyl)propionate hydroxylase
VPIFGVRGANSGIDDADNLAWKLAFVVKGLASDRLFDTYSQERVFATQENLSFGTKSTEFMAPPSFAFKLMRQAVLSLGGCGLRSLITVIPVSRRLLAMSHLCSMAQPSVRRNSAPDHGLALFYLSAHSVSLRR